MTSRALDDYLKQIQDSLALIRMHRPAWLSRYTSGAVLTVSTVEEFESRHGCVLPEEYRQFLLQVGNGGNGPDGLFELGQHFPGSGAVECLNDDVDLSVPFAPSGRDDAGPEIDSSDWNSDYFKPHHANGSMVIGELGCGAWSRLVVTGPFAGQIWHDYRADNAGIFPHMAPDGRRYRFLRWYLDWLEVETYCYGHPGAMRQLRTFPGNQWWQQPDPQEEKQ